MSFNNYFLKEKYKYIRTQMGLDEESKDTDLNFHIREILKSFMQIHKKVAVYCYGQHTQMLFTDFIAELRDVVCIIDNGNVNVESDFQIIKDADIEKYELDGIVISSFRYVDEIKRGIEENHKSVDALDIYDELKKRGISLEHEFYFAGPYQIYSRINKFLPLIDQDGSPDLLKQLLAEYIEIKDFRLAGDISKRIYDITANEKDGMIYDRIMDLYNAEIDQLSRAGKDNALLLCLDGMRRADFFGDSMKKTYEVLKDTSHTYTNAYSYSTMTYESLVPVFEENSDKKTEYYLREEVESKNCRFMKKALDEGRFVAIYGDGNHYIYDDRIKYSGNSQTVTEKLWDFIVDTEGVNNGIFYLHELYESHYSFINPYTKSKLVAQGSAMLFDFLPQNSGKLQTDYKSQQQDALRYLDDTLAPFIEVLPCSMVLFADHGNLMLDTDMRLENISVPQLSAGEEWIRIPLLIRYSDKEAGENNDLISLMSMNDILLSVLSGKKYHYISPDYIKIGRSAIYNQQFKELYRLLDKGYNGEAFEGFIFNNGYKLIVYSDGRKELYKTIDDSLVDDDALIDEFFDKISAEVTVL